MESLQQIKLTQSQMKALRILVEAGSATRGSGSFITIEDKRICTSQTIDALVRRGVIDQINVNDQLEVWEVNETGRKLAKLIFGAQWYLKQTIST